MSIPSTLIDSPLDKYMPDVMHQFVADFIAKHKNQPFFVYYPMALVHAPILRAPDSKAGADKDQLYADNVVYVCRTGRGEAA